MEKNLNAQMNSQMVNEWREAAKKSMYTRKKWTTAEEDIMDAETFASIVNPMFHHIAGNPLIILKTRQDGKTFLKMLIPLDGGAETEMELSYEEEGKLFDEGDEIDKNTLKFCMERFLEQTHLYVTGELVK